MSLNFKKYRKLLDWDDWVYAIIMASSFYLDDKRPIKIDYNIIDPRDFKGYPDIQLEGKICTARLWLWLKILNSMY